MFCFKKSNYSYEEIIIKIEHARRFGKQPGVEVTARALEVLGHPEEGLPFVHVAGTNGKGSVCAFLGSILREAGMKVGVFTSPHLIAFEERIVVDGKRISKEDVVCVSETGCLRRISVWSLRCLIIAC